AEMEIYARSLPETYGQESVPFLYAQPTAELVEGITEPVLPHAEKVSFNEWPESFEKLAVGMAARVN
ncbi:MAG TPA: hypothetical protein VJ952_01805, partial [Opitutales bacterium]|nr:hypothetical protein [Opitutales bacterium]